MNHKRLYTLLLIFTFSLLSKAQHGYDSGHLYDFGLPDGKEVGDSLLKAIPLLLIGFLICWFTMWSKEKQESGNGSNWGFLGCGLMIVGGFFLLPLLAWVELLFQSALGIAIVIAIIIAIIAFIAKFFK